MEELLRRLDILETAMNARFSALTRNHENTGRWNSLRFAVFYHRSAVAAVEDNQTAPFRPGDRVKAMRQTGNKWPLDCESGVPEGEELTVKRAFYDEHDGDWCLEFREIYCKARFPYTFPAAAFILS